jgi:hypothetical protein
VCLSCRIFRCADTGARADIHQLAAGVRTRRALLSELQQQWNELVKVREESGQGWAPLFWGQGMFCCVRCSVVATCLQAISETQRCRIDFASARKGCHCLRRPSSATTHAVVPSLHLQAKASQTELRELRGRLNAARAELTVSQGELVAARTEEARKRELKAAQSKTDATLGERTGRHGIEGKNLRQGGSARGMLPCLPCSGCLLVGGTSGTGKQHCCKARGGLAGPSNVGVIRPVEGQPANHTLEP